MDNDRFLAKGGQGFTLVEVMVAMVIGMIGVIIMMQVFATAEGRKRSTTGTGDVQTAGAMALYELQRDLRQSGYGFGSLGLLKCSLALGAPSNATLPSLGSVLINPRKADGNLLLPAGDASTDTLLVVFGSSSGSPEGDAIVAVDGSQLSVRTPANFSRNDRVVASQAAEEATCARTLATVTAVAAPRVTVDSTGGAGIGWLLFNFGGAPTFRAYAVRAGNLTVCNYLAADCGAACTAADGTCSANWVAIANNIVSLRAQYGRDTANAMDGSVDVWDQSVPTRACHWVRIAALRLGIVARSPQPDRGILTAAAPVWEGSATAAFDLSGTSKWQNYRYKVFETVVPLRNLPWMAGCTL